MLSHVYPGKVVKNPRYDVYFHDGASGLDTGGNAPAAASCSGQGSVVCPICQARVFGRDINRHLDEAPGDTTSKKPIDSDLDFGGADDESDASGDEASSGSDSSVFTPIELTAPDPQTSTTALIWPL